ncbi:ABC transporter permease [Leucobacter luti]|uniref:ABC-type nitrate/sulfonate/bicarbonate transport system permease component n=1 Tax=Leucobacter luti TaxID=340320 RepID=A0A4Q7U1C0_9MICO|nr:ABC transporter permease [Leucobacter luti]MBL3699189.1 ABC transporter permease [Leucobacter luti]RZT66687.1 ABC-type nitrate/sulfonate/bicarbonate transport system permease component [Leucobacter luti]
MTTTTVRDASVRRIPDWVLGAAGVLALLIVLELLPQLGMVDARYLPPVSEMLGALFAIATTSTFWIALGQTLLTWLIGLGISLLAGVGIGVLLGTVGWLREYTASTIEFLRPVPSVALIPVAVLLLGTGMPSTLLLVVYASFWQILMQVMAGVQDIDPVASDTARSYRFRPLTRIRSVVWPTTLPFAMTGLRLAASVALILTVTVTGELLISGDGIGGRLALARESGAVAPMYAYVIVAGALGVIVNVIARATERRTLSWHPSIRTEAHA